MLKASGDTRRRMAAMAGAMALIVGGVTVGGMLQRLRDSALPSPAAESSDNAAKLTHYRSMLDRLRWMAARKDWKGVVSYTDAGCAEGEPCDAALRFARFEAWMRLGNPERALEGQAALGLAKGPAGVACVLALRGDRQGYLAHTGAILRAADLVKMESTEANNAAWTCVLMRGATPEPGKVVALSRKAVSRVSGADRANFRNTLGVALYRNSQDAEAVEVLKQAEAFESSPYNEVFLALAHRRLGHRAEAARFASAFRTHMDSTFGRTESVRQEKILFLRELDEAMPLKSGGSDS